MVVYIEREGREFGLEDRVTIRKETKGQPDEVLHRVTPAAIYTFPVLRARVWALTHGYGFVPVR